MFDDLSVPGNYLQAILSYELGLVLAEPALEEDLGGVHVRLGDGTGRIRRDSCRDAGGRRVDLVLEVEIPVKGRAVLSVRSRKGFLVETGLGRALDTIGGHLASTPVEMRAAWETAPDGEERLRCWGLRLQRTLDAAEILRDEGGRTQALRARFDLIPETWIGTTAQVAGEYRIAA